MLPSMIYTPTYRATMGEENAHNCAIASGTAMMGDRTSKPLNGYCISQLYIRLLKNKKKAN
ncbi:MAG: hypothetical protein DSM106950_05645 [Stigonema ocellatum SAG 48.90 = DSM 106950]|nr:hypothetical protein [Stigonema ocellatum SAG 48.90 = DSM 106950]